MALRAHACCCPFPPTPGGQFRGFSPCSYVKAPKKFSKDLTGFGRLVRQRGMRHQLRPERGLSTLAARCTVLHGSHSPSSLPPSTCRGSTFAARCPVVHASRFFTAVPLSSPASGMAAPIASPVASRAGRGEGPLSRITARFAGLSVCRHSYATPNSKQDQGGLCHVLYQSRFCVPCTRRLR